MSTAIARGVWASVISSFGFATMDAATRALVQTMHPSAALVLRTVFLLAGTFAWVLLARRSGVFATGTISDPLTIDRKLFHPARITCTTCTTKNAQKPIVSQKCSQRAIS